jgi:hypothetical protein
MTTTPNLYQRLVAIMAEAGTIKKLGFNEFDKYSYVKESDIAEKMQALFVKHGVFVTNSVIEHSSTQVTSSTGKPSILSSVVSLYTFINADNPSERHEVRAVGDGMDRGDKAIYKALTGAHKYFLIRNFNLGSEEDAEKESPEKESAPARAVAPQARGQQNGVKDTNALRF